jgi:hypothetical protein
MGGNPYGAACRTSRRALHAGEIEVGLTQGASDVPWMASFRCYGIHLSRATREGRPQYSLAAVCSST